MSIPMRILFPILLAASLVLPAGAIPNSIFGPVAQAESPLNGQDLTDVFLGEDLWAGVSAAPGRWQDEASVPGTRSSFLLARPDLFGLETTLVRRLTRGDSLEEVQVTFADAGSFFGYFDEKLPEGLSRRARAEEVERRLAQRQAEFSDLYQATISDLRTALADRAERKRAREIKVGRSRTTRAVMEEYELGSVKARLLASPDRLVRVSFVRAENESDGWLDRELAALSDRDYQGWLRERVTTNEHGDVILGGMEIVPQGYKPYCGLNTLTMAARYLGLHLDEDWLAAAGEFQNTGSAAGSRMLSLYASVASEAGLRMDRSSRFDGNLVRKSLADGFPVVVWRRWSRERDHEHSAVTRAVERGREATFKHEEDSYPGESAPLHASVIVGYNEERREFLFLESWSSRGKPRRMLDREMEATAYLTFCFRPD